MTHSTYEGEKCNLDWLYRKYRGICWICRKFCSRDQASRDHILPASLGGTRARENQALAHKRCNTKRGNGYKEIHFRFYMNDAIEDVKDIAILEQHGLIIQFGRDRKKEGFYIVVAKKQEDTNGNNGKAGTHP